MKTLLLVLTAVSLCGALSAGDAPPASPAARIDVNRASEAELMTLPGVNRETARRIIARRPFPNRAKFLDVLAMPPAQMQLVAMRTVVGGASEPAVPAPLPKEAPPARHPAESSTKRMIRPDPSAPAGPSARAPLPPAGRADVNTATLEEIQRAAGLDVRSAQMIIANRPYRSLSELSRAGYLHDRIIELSHFLKVVPATVPTK